MMMHDVIVIGQGPAGISAAIYVVRSGLSVLVLARDKGSLEKAGKIENYYGFPDPISGLDLLKRGIDQARRLGVEIHEEEVTSVHFEDHFTVETAQSSFLTNSVILATGMPRKRPGIPGLSDFEGRGVSYCATCDGFFYKNKTVAVVGNGAYALKEASELKPFAKTIYLITNGRPYEAPFKDPDLVIRTEKIEKLAGDDEKLRELILSTGERLSVDGVFIAEGTASALDLALKLGLNHDGRTILVNQKQETNLPGLFAAGDCTGGLMQIAVAVGSGAQAGISSASFVRALKGHKPLPKAQWG